MEDIAASSRFWCFIVEKYMREIITDTIEHRKTSAQWATQVKSRAHTGNSQCKATPKNTGIAIFTIIYIFTFCAFCSTQAYIRVISFWNRSSQDQTFLSATSSSKALPGIWNIRKAEDRLRKHKETGMDSMLQTPALSKAQRLANKVNKSDMSDL